MDKTKQHNIGNMAKTFQDEIETTADENGVFSDSSSDVEIRYDKQQRKLTAKLDDELFDVKLKKYDAQNELLKDMLKSIYGKLKSNESIAINIQIRYITMKL